MSKPITYLLLLMICAAFPYVCDLNAQTNGWIVDYRPGLFSEFLIDSNACPILFPSNQHEPVLHRGQDGKWYKTNLITEGVICDVVSIGQNNWCLLEKSLTNNCAKIYNYNGSELFLKDTTICPFDSPLLNVVTDGVYVITWASKGNGCMGVYGHAQFSNPGYCPIAPMLSINVPGYGMWLWSHIEYEALGSDCLNNPHGVFLVCKDRMRKYIGCPSANLGGMVLVGSNMLVCGTPSKGFFSIKAEGGSVQGLPWRLPTNDLCIFLHYQPSGQYIIISSPSVNNSNRVIGVNGRIGSLLTIKDDQEHVILDGVDSGPIRHDKGRPAVDTPMGTFIARAYAGLVFVSTNPAVCWYTDWRHGFPLPNIDRMRVKDDKLYLLDRKRGFVVADWRKMINCPFTQKNNDWKEYLGASNPMLSSDGTVWFLTADIPVKLRCVSGERIDDYPLRDADLPMFPAPRLSEDTRRRVWIFSGCETGQVSVFDNNKLTYFNSRDEAYSAYARQETNNIDYRIGNPSPHYYPAFSGDGRVAYCASSGSLRYFDGMSWGEEKTSSIFEGKPFSDHPYYNQGILTVWAGDSLFQLANGKWGKVQNAKPKPFLKPIQMIDRCLLESFPGDKTNCPIKLRDNIGTIWAGSPDKLYRGLGDYWIPFNTAETPLIMAETISNIIVDDANGIWFEIEGWDYKRLAYYYHKDPQLKLEWVKPPLKETTNGNIDFYVQSLPFDNPIVFQYDQDEWKPVKSGSRTRQIFFENLQNGQHTLRVRVFNKQLRYFTTLTHIFKVDANYGAKSQNLILQLNTDNFEQRENAARQLVEIGDPALKELRHAKAIDSDHAWWIQAVSDQILRNQSIDQ